MRVHWVVWSLSLSACFSMRGSKGGGQVSAKDAERAATRHASPYAIDVPVGYRVELVTEKLTFPTGVALGPHGEIFVVEAGYSYGEELTRPRIVRVGAHGEQTELATGDPTRDGAPWNGIAYGDGALYVAQGGELSGGRIARFPLDGARLGAPTILVDGLPSIGDHHTDGPVVSSDGWVYFGQGTATNSSVVGKDNAEYGWLSRHPDFHDTPCKDIVLTGTNFKTDDGAVTGAYQPYGHPSTPGQRVPGHVPCNGAIMRVRTTGGPVELVAWGFRNPFGVAFDANGQLYATDNGFDTRGSRPVFGAADVLWRVQPGAWYGWPDFAEGRPLTSEWYSEDKGRTAGFMLAEHPGVPPDPVAYLPCHSAATGLDISRNDAFGHEGHAFIALFGDLAPTAGKVLHPVGFEIMRVDPRTGDLEPFARNHADTTAPASKEHGRGFERPIAARFSPDGTALYVVDFGVLRVTKDGPKPEAGTGKLWRITKEVAIAH